MIKLIGAGPGNPKYLSNYALDLIKNSNTVIGFRRIAKSLEEYNPNIIVVDKVSEAVEILEDKKEGVLLASGDSLFFGIGELIKSKGIEIDEIVPGISSVQYLFSKIQKSYSNVTTVSVHGRDFDFKNIEAGKSYAFLIDSKRGANYISRNLKELGHSGSIVAGYNLSYEDEKIIEFKIGEHIDEVSELGVVII